jgi:hypothetical protein
MESPKADAIEDGVQVPLGKLKEGISGGEGLSSESCGLFNVGEIEGKGDGDGGGGVMGIGCGSVRPPHVLAVVHPAARG